MDWINEYLAYNSDRDRRIRVMATVIYPTPWGQHVRPEHTNGVRTSYRYVAEAYDRAFPEQ